MSCLEHRKSGSSRLAAGDDSSRNHRTFIRVTRLVPRVPCLRATRFPSQSTFCRERNSPSLAAMLCRDAYSEGIPSKHAPRAPVHPISAARVLTNPAASFGLDTLLVRALSSPHLSDARMLPSDVCHPIHLYPSAPALSTLTRFLEFALESREESPVHAGRPASAGPLEHLQAVHLRASRRSSPSDASVAIPARSPWSLNRAWACTWTA